MESQGLPITKYKEQITNFIEREPVIIISGKTGCGKSTQVPQFILERWPDAVVAICEPRRLAATSLAVRVSHQQKCKLGREVGYHIGMEMYASQNTKLLFMTYGILIHELMYQQKLSYTHILLDQVHERSLEMDFAFIALKTILNQRYKNKIKLVIMSATLNSQQFSQYFRTHKDTRNFFIPIISLHEAVNVPQSRERRGNRGLQQSQSQKRYSVSSPDQNYLLARSLTLTQERQFSVDEFYLDDLDQKSMISYYGEEIRFMDEMYSQTLRLLLKYEGKLNGDILIFIPGLLEIKILKQKIIKEMHVDETRIIEVHSLFSEDLYWRLFDHRVRNKIIIATNMGQSSITLPECRIVIDFCLTRKNFSNKMKGLSRFQTRLASKANLTQRSGRVGRVAQGIVYRLITKQQYKNLPDFDIPQIKCVSLEMVILRAKQLDQTNKSDLFENPYSMLLGAIQPPEVRQIQEAVKCLLSEEALVNVNQKLQLTRVGEFMVSMPCDLRISKMILFGLKLQIPQVLIGIASIIMCQKPFFAHEERRPKIQQFLHSLVGYDEGCYNDFLLRQHIFNHWRRQFYLPFKQKRMYQKKHKWIGKESTEIIKQQEQKNPALRKYRQQDNQQEIYKFLQEFSHDKLSKQEQNWCQDRGIYPNCMRQILKIDESIRMKLESLNHTFINQQIRNNELVLLCLIYAFPDTQCQITFSLTERHRGTVYEGDSFDTRFVELPKCKETQRKYIDDYCRPLKQYKIVQLNDQPKIRLYGTPSILSKFLLPFHYNKGSIGNSSYLYQHLSKKKPFYYFTSLVSQKRRPILVLNESINRVNIRLRLDSNYFLITNTIMESKDKKMINASALVEERTFHMIQLITKSNVSISPHVSLEFYDRFQIDSSVYEFSSLITMEDLKVILQMRTLSKRQKNNSITSPQERMPQKDIQRLINLLTNTKRKQQKQPWENMFIAQKYKNAKRRQFYPIDEAPPLVTERKYFQEYYNWKYKKYHDFFADYRTLTIQKSIIICKKCDPQIVQIEFFSTYDPVSLQLRMNEYSGSWKVVPSNPHALLCRNHHQIGNVINEDAATLIHQQLIIYSPYKNFQKFPAIWGPQDQEQLEMNEIAGLERLKFEKDKIQNFVCFFCMQNSEEDQPMPKKFDRDTLRHNFWKKTLEHMRSREHLQNVNKFLKHKWGE